MKQLIARLREIHDNYYGGGSIDTLDTMEVFDALPQLLGRLEKLETVAEVAKIYLPYVPVGDLLGANKYVDQNHKAKHLRDTLAALETGNG